MNWSQNLFGFRVCLVDSVGGADQSLLKFLLFQGMGASSSSPLTPCHRATQWVNSAMRELESGIPSWHPIFPGPLGTNTRSMWIQVGDEQTWAGVRDMKWACGGWSGDAESDVDQNGTAKVNQGAAPSTLVPLFLSSVSDIAV